MGGYSSSVLIPSKGVSDFDNNKVAVDDNRAAVVDDEFGYGV